MNEVQNSGSGIAYRIWGSGSTTIVIDTALGTCSAEWWHIAEKLSEEFRVVTFDRLGCGRSKTPTNARTPQNIAAELDNLLASLGIDNSITLLGHSQGGFYSMQYALMYPSKVTGMVLLDPATPYDNEFAKRLSKEQYKQSGVDKTLGLRLGKALTSLKLGFMFKPLLKKMPPFYYYDFSKGGVYKLTFRTRNFLNKNEMSEYPKPCTIQFTINDSNSFQYEDRLWLLKQFDWPEVNEKDNKMWTP